MKTHNNIRKIEFDIFKGLMIISVVIGHTDVTIPYINVFWFHMPAFFLVSGYLTADWRLDKNSWKKKIKKFVIPYITYSILLYIIFQPEPIIKNIARTIYAGRYNITMYSYPFWFINSLLVVNVAYCLMNKFLDNRLLTLVKWGGKSLLFRYHLRGLLSFDSYIRLSSVAYTSAMGCGCGNRSFCILLHR